MNIVTPDLCTVEMALLTRKNTSKSEIKNHEQGYLAKKDAAAATATRTAIATTDNNNNAMQPTLPKLQRRQKKQNTTNRVTVITSIQRRLEHSANVPPPDFHSLLTSADKFLGKRRIRKRPLCVSISVAIQCFNVCSVSGQHICFF
jgi:hypothetical protein